MLNSKILAIPFLIRMSVVDASIGLTFVLLLYCIIRSTPSRSNKVGLNVSPYVCRLYVRPSVRPQKVFRFQQNLIVRGWNTTVCRMTRSKVKVKVKVTEVRQLRKWPISKSAFSAGMQKTDGESW